VEAYKIYMNLIWLYGAVGTGAGDEAGGADYRPTDTQIAVFTEIQAQLDRARTDFERALSVDVPAFNTAMSRKGLPPLGDTTDQPRTVKTRKYW
jgi:hypothetical protein